MPVVEFRGNRIAIEPGRGILEYSPTHNHRTSQVTEFEYNNGPGTHTHPRYAHKPPRIHIYTGEHSAGLANAPSATRSRLFFPSIHDHGGYRGRVVDFQVLFNPVPGSNHGAFFLTVRFLGNWSFFFFLSFRSSMEIADLKLIRCINVHARLVNHVSSFDTLYVLIYSSIDIIINLG